MDTILVDAEQKFRTEHPEKFSHPDCQLGEIWLGDQSLDIANINVNFYKKNGVPSARIGENPIINKVRCSGVKERMVVEIEKEYRRYSVFVDLSEYLQHLSVKKVS